MGVKERMIDEDITYDEAVSREIDMVDWFYEMHKDRMMMERIDKRYESIRKERGV